MIPTLKLYLFLFLIRQFHHVIIKTRHKVLHQWNLRQHPYILISNCICNILIILLLYIVPYKSHSIFIVSFKGYITILFRVCQDPLQWSIFDEFKIVYIKIRLWNQVFPVLCWYVQIRDTPVAHVQIVPSDGMFTGCLVVVQVFIAACTTNFRFLTILKISHSRLEASSRYEFWLKSSLRPV